MTRLLTETGIRCLVLRIRPYRIGIVGERGALWEEKWSRLMRGALLGAWKSFDSDYDDVI